MFNSRDFRVQHTAHICREASTTAAAHMIALCERISATSRDIAACVVEQESKAGWEIASRADNIGARKSNFPRTVRDI